MCEMFCTERGRQWSIPLFTNAVAGYLGAACECLLYTSHLIVLEKAAEFAFFVLPYHASMAPIQRHTTMECQPEGWRYLHANKKKLL